MAVFDGNIAEGVASDSKNDKDESEKRGEWCSCRLKANIRFAQYHLRHCGCDVTFCDSDRPTRPIIRHVIGLLSMKQYLTLSSMDSNSSLDPYIVFGYGSLIWKVSITFTATS